MGNRDHLVAKQIVNSLGHTTTVYVSPDDVPKLNAVLKGSPVSVSNAGRLSEYADIPANAISDAEMNLGQYFATAGDAQRMYTGTFDDGRKFLMIPSTEDEPSSDQATEDGHTGHYQVLLEDTIPYGDPSTGDYEWPEIQTVSDEEYDAAPKEGQEYLIRRSDPDINVVKSKIEMQMMRTEGVVKNRRRENEEIKTTPPVKQQARSSVDWEQRLRSASGDEPDDYVQGDPMRAGLLALKNGASYGDAAKRAAAVDSAATPFDKTARDAELDSALSDPKLRDAIEQSMRAFSPRQSERQWNKLNKRLEGIEPNEFQRERLIGDLQLRVAELGWTIREGQWNYWDNDGNLKPNPFKNVGASEVELSDKHFG